MNTIVPFLMILLQIYSVLQQARSSILSTIVPQICPSLKLMEMQFLFPLPCFDRNVNTGNKQYMQVISSPGHLILKQQIMFHNRRNQNLHTPSTEADQHPADLTQHFYLQSLFPVLTSLIQSQNNRIISLVNLHPLLHLWPLLELCSLPIVILQSTSLATCTYQKAFLVTLFLHVLLFYTIPNYKILLSVPYG